MQYNPYNPELHPLQETKAIIMDTISGYKTTAAKKSFMTREINGHKYFMNEVKDAIENGRGWYLGKVYKQYHLDFYKREMELFQSIKSSL